MLIFFIRWFYDSFEGANVTKEYTHLCVVLQALIWSVNSFSSQIIIHIKPKATCKCQTDVNATFSGKSLGKEQIVVLIKKYKYPMFVKENTNLKESRQEYLWGLGGRKG